MNYNKKCEYCGTKFSTENKNKRFCTISCSSKYMHENRPLTERFCKSCGKKIVYKGTTKKLYCEECRKKKNIENTTKCRVVKGKMKPENVGIGSGNTELSGKDSRHYKNGIGIYKHLRIRYLEDSNVPIECEECGSIRNLQTHHIDEDRSNNELDNLILLCKKCHKSKHIGGEKNHGAKLTNNQIVFIYTNPLNLTPYDLSILFGLGSSHIRGIQLGKINSYITKDLKHNLIKNIIGKNFYFVKNVITKEEFYIKNISKFSKEILKLDSSYANKKIRANEQIKEYVLKKVTECEYKNYTIKKYKHLIPNA